MTKQEVWQPVLGYEGLYEASNMGNIRRSFDAPSRSLGVPGKHLSPVETLKGYLRVSLSKNGDVKNFPAHRVILSAFCGPPPFPEAHAAHNNGDPSDNRLTNLRWATPTENQKDVDRHGNRVRGSDVYGALLDTEKVLEIKKRLEKGTETQTKIAEDFGVSKSTVSLISRNRIWKHVGAPS